METTIICRGYIGIMGKKMEAAIICRGYIEIVEKKTETTIVYRDYISRCGSVVFRTVAHITLGEDLSLP